MTVRLLIPYAGKQIGQLYTGSASQERALIDAAQADGNLQAATDYSSMYGIGTWLAPIVTGASSVTGNGTLLSTASQGAIVAALSDPYAGQGFGTTTYTDVSGDAQLAVSGANIVVGGSTVTAGTTYSKYVRANRGDNKADVGSTLTFTAQAGAVGPATSVWRAVGAGLRIPNQFSNALAITSRKVITLNAATRYLKIVIPHFARFTGSQGVTLTLTSGSKQVTIANTARDAAPFPGTYINGTGIPTNTTLTSQVSGTPGGDGVYMMNVAATAGDGTTTSSGTIGGYNDSLFKQQAAQMTWQAACECPLNQSRTGLSGNRPNFLFGGQNTLAYNYFTWNKSVYATTSDSLDLGQVYPAGTKLAIWLTCELPSANAGIPSSVIGSSFTERWEGQNQTGTSQIASNYASTGTSITNLNTTQVGATLMITPAAVLGYVDPSSRATVLLGDSIGRGLNEGQSGSGSNGDAEGSASGAFGFLDRWAFDQKNSAAVNLCIASDRGGFMSGAPLSWQGIQQIITASNPTSVVNQHKQNDRTNSNPLTWASGLSYGRVNQTVLAGSNYYYVTVPGVAGGTAPTSTTPGVDITDGAATLRFIGTTTDLPNQATAGMLAYEAGINRVVATLVPSAAIIDTQLLPFTSSQAYSTGATSSGTTGTISLPAAYVAQVNVGDTKQVAGFNVSGYNGTVTITAKDTVNNTLSYTLPAGGSGLANATGGYINDLWTTGAGQIKDTGFATPLAYRALITMPRWMTFLGTSAVLDPNPGVEGDPSSANTYTSGSYLWRWNNQNYGYTFDGIHPNSTGYVSASTATNMLLVSP